MIPLPLAEIRRLLTSLIWTPVIIGTKERSAALLPKPTAWATYAVTATTRGPSNSELRAVGITGDGGPYRPHDPEALQALVKWASARGLRYSEHGRCLDWLRRGRCASRSDEHTYARPHTGGGWADHVSGWTRDGRPALLIAQPYGLGPDSLADLAALGREPDLDVEVDGTGWYGHGTVLVTFKPSSATT